MATFNHTFMPSMLNMALYVLNFSLRQVDLWEDSWHLLHVGVSWHSRLCNYTLKCSELNLCRRNIVKTIQPAAFDSIGLIAVDKSPIASLLINVKICFFLQSVVPKMWTVCRTNWDISVFIGESHSEGRSNGTVQCCSEYPFAGPHPQLRICHWSMILLVLCGRVNWFFSLLRE